LSFVTILSEYQRAFLKTYPPPQTFAVVSWGCAATVWLSRVLNSHPDIYCVHAANQTWSVLGGGPRIDGIEYIRVVGVNGYGHIAAGDVHGVSRDHVPELRSLLSESFNAVVVVREPIPRLRSQLALFADYGDIEEARSTVWNIDYVDGIIARCRLNLPRNDYESRFFVHAVNMLNAILYERTVGRIFRCEDLTRHPEALGPFVEEITRGKVTAKSDWLGTAVSTPKLNVHGTRSPSDFTDWQWDVIHKVVEPRSWEAYAELGYVGLWNEQARLDALP
jgi:hypothetical protein